MPNDELGRTPANFANRKCVHKSGLAVFEARRDAGERKYLHFEIAIPEPNGRVIHSPGSAELVGTFCMSMIRRRCPSVAVNAASSG